MGFSAIACGDTTATPADSNSDEGTATYTLSAAVPTFTPTDGAITGSTDVTIASAAGAASICYRMDGVTAACNAADGSTCAASNTRYTSAVTITATTTISAIACGGTTATPADSNSDEGTATYTLSAAVP